jgi:preprotein translocase subunit SecG
VENIIGTVLLGLHILIAVLLVGLVLLQRSEGGALGIGGGTMGGLMSARGAASNITRATGILAACFIATSLALAILAGNAREPRSILDQPPSAPAQQQPATPTGPEVPLAR